MELYEPVHHNINRFILAMTGNRDEAKDILSETLLIAFRDLERLRNEKAFLHWLFGISNRVFKKRLAKNRRYTSLSEAGDFPGKESDPHVSADKEILYQALQELPLKQREAVILFELTGYSIKEIREIQGGTISSVKSRLKRGREKLAELLCDSEKKSTKKKKGSILK